MDPDPNVGTQFGTFNSDDVDMGEVSDSAEDLRKRITRKRKPKKDTRKKSPRQKNARKASEPKKNEGKVQTPKVMLPPPGKSENPAPTDPNADIAKVIQYKLCTYKYVSYKRSQIPS